MTALPGAVALVTGANRGIGKEFVQQLLDRGVAKVYAAARDPQSVSHPDPRVVPLALDVTDTDSVARAAAQAPDVTVLINNAGSPPLRRCSASTPRTCAASWKSTCSGPSR